MKWLLAVINISIWWDWIWSVKNVNSLTFSDQECEQSDVLLVISKKCEMAEILEYKKSDFFMAENMESI